GKRGRRRSPTSSRSPAPGDLRRVACECRRGRYDAAVSGFVHSAVTGPPYPRMYARMLSESAPPPSSPRAGGSAFAGAPAEAFPVAGASSTCQRRSSSTILSLFKRPPPPRGHSPEFRSSSPSSGRRCEKSPVGRTGRAEPLFAGDAAQAALILEELTLELVQRRRALWAQGGRKDFVVFRGERRLDGHAPLEGVPDLCRRTGITLTFEDVDQQARSRRGEPDSGDPHGGDATRAPA